jgi:hypothetical protein
MSEIGFTSTITVEEFIASFSKEDLERYTTLVAVKSSPIGN